MKRLDSKAERLDKDKKVTHQGAVGVIRGRIASAVDRVELQMWTGQTRAYGGQGGDPTGPFRLKGDEWIRAVEQEYRDSDLGYLGNELAFFTSKGRVVTFTGKFARRVHRFSTAEGFEITKLHFNGSSLCGIDSSPVSPNGGNISKVSCRMGWYIDQIILSKRHTGEALSYGSEGGQFQNPFVLNPSEHLVAVAQEDNEGKFLGSAIAFFVSNGDVIRFDGRNSGRRARFAANNGQQIVGLHFEQSRLARVMLCTHAQCARPNDHRDEELDAE